MGEKEEEKNNKNKTNKNDQVVDFFDFLLKNVRSWLRTALKGYKVSVARGQVKHFNRFYIPLATILLKCHSCRRLLFEVN